MIGRTKKYLPKYDHREIKWILDYIITAQTSIRQADDLVGSFLVFFFLWTASRDKYIHSSSYQQRCSLHRLLSNFKQNHEKRLKNKTILIKQWFIIV